LALIVLKRDLGGKPDADDIRAHLRDYATKGVISTLAIPDHFRFVDALERTSVGKLNKKATRDKYGNGPR
jgi:fatty-acyl-CoA synthase